MAKMRIVSTPLVLITDSVAAYWKMNLTKYHTAISSMDTRRICISTLRCGRLLKSVVQSIITNHPKIAKYSERQAQWLLLNSSGK